MKINLMALRKYIIWTVAIVAIMVVLYLFFDAFGTGVINWELLVEYLKVMCSVPVIAGIVVLAFILIFRPEIREWIRYLVIKRGDVEISSIQPQPTPAEDEELEDIKSQKEKWEVLEQEVKDQIVQLKALKLESVAPKLTPLTTLLDELEDSLSKESERTKFWEFKYLELFLVGSSNMALTILSHEAPLQLRILKRRLKSRNIHRYDINNVTYTLAFHGLINIDETETVSLTDKGKEYVDWANLSDLYWKGLPLPLPRNFPPKAPED